MPGNIRNIKNKISITKKTRGFPGSSVVKNPLANAGDAGLNPGSGRFPTGRNGNPLPVFLLGKFLGQRSLVGYSSHDCKELDTTEHRVHVYTSGQFLVWKREKEHQKMTNLAHLTR